MDVKFFMDSSKWGNLLDEAVQESKYIGVGSKDEFELLGKGDSCSQKKLSLKQIIDRSEQFQNSGSANQIASSLKIMAAKTEEKHYSGIWKIMKIFMPSSMVFEVKVSKQRLAKRIVWPI